MMVTEINDSKVFRIVIYNLVGCCCSPDSHASACSVCLQPHPNYFLLFLSKFHLAKSSDCTFSLGLFTPLSLFTLNRWMYVIHSTAPPHFNLTQGLIRQNNWKHLCRFAAPLILYSVCCPNGVSSYTLRICHWIYFLTDERNRNSLSDHPQTLFLPPELFCLRWSLQINFNSQHLSRQRMKIKLSFFSTGDVQLILTAST